MSKQIQNQQQQQNAMPPKKRKSGGGGSKICGAIKSTIHSQDMFGESVSQKIDGGDDAVRTGLGSCCSIMLLLITLLYAYQKLLVLIQKKDVNILTGEKDLHFNDMDRFGYDKGMNIAVAFSSYNSETELELDPSYGHIIFKTYSWGYDADGKTFVAIEEIEPHVCTHEELNSDGKSENPSFYKSHAAAAWYAKTYQKKFVCADPSDMYIHGDFNSGSARMMTVQLQECHGHDYCKTKQEIQKYFSGKFLLLLLNQVRFQTEKFGKEAVIKESHITWLVINTQQQQTTPFKLTETKLYLQDKLLNFDELTEDELSSVFKMEQLVPYSFEKDKVTMMNVTFERNLNLTVVARDGYTILDWISDIGGIQGILISAVAIIVSFWNYNWLDNTLVSRLYRIEKQDASHKVYSCIEDRTESVQTGVLSGLRDYLCDLLPSCLQCCRSGRNERGLSLGRDQLEKENNFVKTLQQRRYFSAALKTLLSKSQRENLKDQTRYWVFRLDDERKNENQSDSDAESGISVRSSQLDFDHNIGKAIDPEAKCLNEIEMQDQTMRDEPPVSHLAPTSTTKKGITPSAGKGRSQSVAVSRNRTNSHDQGKRQDHTRNRSSDSYQSDQSSPPRARSRARPRNRKRDARSSSEEEPRQGASKKRPQAKANGPKQRIKRGNSKDEGNYAWQDAPSKKLDKKQKRAKGGA